MGRKRLFAVLIVVAVGIVGITAWVVVTAPPAVPVWASASAVPSTDQIYAANRGEMGSALATVSAAAGPSLEQIYAANQGQLPTRTARVASSSAGPTSEQIYAANRGEL